MTRGKQNKLYRSFNKGLITEAGFLTYPEDASIDELNTVLYRKGNRSRRLGMDYETGSTSITFTGVTIGNKTPTTEYFWRAPGNKGDLNFLVTQVGDTLFFFDASVAPLSSGKKSFTVNMQQFKAPAATADQIRNTNVQMAGGKGFLFVAQQYIDPFTVTYNPATDTIETIRVWIMIRDFDGVNDNLPNDAEPSALTIEHHYNLKNQGWVTPGSPSVQTTTPGSPSTPTPTTPVPPPTGTAPPSTPVYQNPWTGGSYQYSGPTWAPWQMEEV